MDINRLEEFIVLADCLNFSKAAKLLFETQSSLSRHINELEKNLGEPLFIRDTHKVALTPAGEFAAHELREVVESYHKAMRNIKLAADDLNSRISVGFLGHAVQPFITQFIRFLGAQSSIEVDYTSCTELDTLIRFVDTGVVDLAFITHIELDQINGMEIRWIMDDPLYIVVPENHSLAAREELSVRELSGVPMIVYNRDTNPHTAIFHEKMFQRLGVEMNVVRKVSNIESGLFYASLGIGFFIIPKHLLSMAKDLIALPIPVVDGTISLHLAWKKSNRKTGIQIFVNEFSTFYKNEFD